MSKLAVIGGGAAGFFCAINAARLNPSLKVVILEKTSKLLAKVRISGGGRCNVTHACFDISEIIKKYPRGKNFVKKTFHQFFTTDTIEWFESRGVKLKTEADGRMFPVTDSSHTIIDCLLHEANKFSVEILLNRNVKHLQPHEHQWKILLENDDELIADHVCIACGGYPKSENFSWLTELGHTFEAPVPSLFTFNIPSHPVTALMGISMPEVAMKIAGTKYEERGPLLITHWGLSGPAVLRLSAWAAKELEQRDYSFHVLVNWLPDFHHQSLIEKLRQLKVENSSVKMSQQNPFKIPVRLWEYFLNDSGIHDLRWSELPNLLLNKLAKTLTTSEFSVKGKTTYKEEFVTAGGIKLNEIDPNTMGSKLHPNLFFAGEILDVDGITGGFNFQHAWTSGWIAAKAITG